MTEIRQNVTGGKWAVAMVGYRQWMRDMAMGDGITSALCALLTRCETREEAERLADALNDEQPGVMPGSRAIPVYEARLYSKTDYLSQQARRNGDRDCDRRVIHL